MKQNNRYYEYWDKKIARYEKKHKLFDRGYEWQIKRAYKRGKITQEQYEELQKRITTLSLKYFGYPVALIDEVCG